MAATTNSTVDGTVYIHALAASIRSHETKLAEFNRRHPPLPTSSLSWTSVLTLGLASAAPAVRKPPLVLTFDPHHLYYLLLKFDEVGVDGIGSLDVLIDGGPSRPMSYAFGGQNGIPGLWRGGQRDNSDNISLRSTFSAVSSFSLGSTWWNSTPPVIDSTIDVKYLYSSCTKLPALRLTPFAFSTTSASTPTLSKPVQDFQDCPPPNTAVPLHAFKNLQSLILEDLDPRAFLGWDVLSAQLRSLEVHRGGIEDIGELICDAVVEDLERRKKGRGGVGEERRKRRSHLSVTEEEENEEITDTTCDYLSPPSSAWQSLVHLSLSANSLTFIPSPPLQHLSVLTSLDLSSNLLIAIPPGFALLTSLRSLNLSDNMIDSLIGISKALSSIVVINLSKNRIENLSGLDRLDSLQRLDLRENRIMEALEISRLAVLPRLGEVWIAGNPFAKSIPEGGEEGYRIKCFNYFAKEGREGVKLDGTGPGMNERRGIIEKTRNAAELSSKGQTSLGRTGGVKVLGEEAMMAGGTKVVGRRALPVVSSTFEVSNPPASHSGHHIDTSTIPASASASGVKSKRRKPHRIVDLDSPGQIKEDGTGPSDSDQALSPHLSPLLHAQRSATIPTIEESTPGQISSEDAALSTASTSSRVTLTSGLSQSMRNKESPSKRRDRLSVSTFEPSSSTQLSTSPNSSSTETPSSSNTSSRSRGDDRIQVTSVLQEESSSEAFRKKIEALRSDVGSNWMTTLGERQLVAERSAIDRKQSIEVAGGLNEEVATKVVGKRKKKKGKEKEKEKEKERVDG